MKRGTEEARLGDFKWWSEKKGNRLLRLYDSYSTGGGVMMCHKCHSWVRSNRKIPAQGCDALLLIAPVSATPERPVGRPQPAVAQLEFKSVIGDKENLYRIREDQLAALKDSKAKGLPYWIIVDFVMPDKVYHAALSAKFWCMYEDTKDTRPYKTMAITIAQLESLKAQHESLGFTFSVSDDKKMNCGVESIYDYIVANS